MSIVSNPAPSRFLALWLPLLPTDRIRRRQGGASWRSHDSIPATPVRRSPAGASTPGPADGFEVPALEFSEATGSAHRSPKRPGLKRLPAGAGGGAVAQGRFAPLALYARTGNRYSIRSVCEAGEAAGLRPGAHLAEARARFPGFAFEEADPAADLSLLEAIADWCDRYTPLVALDPPAGLMLDITGCTHLFAGGERELMTDLLARLKRQGLRARAAIAGKAATAAALVRFAPDTCLADGGEEAALAPLPVAALRLPSETALLLARLGLKRIGDLQRLPRAGLARRFGQALVRVLDESLGRCERPIEPRLPLPLIIHERRLFEPISRPEDVLSLAEHLAGRLRTDLERRGRGARRLELALFRVDGKVERIPLRTVAPLREPKRIARLFAERLKGSSDELDAGFGYDLVRLAVLDDDPMESAQGEFEERAEGGGEPIEALLDRLAARLGEVAVFGLGGVESHRPERAQERAAPLASGRPETGSGPQECAPRPLRLLDEPEPIEATALVPEGAPEQFRWRRGLHRVRHVEGPERIAPEWWRGETQATRDYWRVEDEEGRRYWLFRRSERPEDEPEEDGGTAAAAAPDGTGNDGRSAVAAGRSGGNTPDGALGTLVPMQVPTWYLHGIFA